MNDIVLNADVNSGNHKAVLASNYTLQLRIHECHVGMKCDLKGTCTNIIRIVSGCPMARNINHI